MNAVSIVLKKGFCGQKKCQQISAWQMINLAWANAVFVKKTHDAIKRQSIFHSGIYLFNDDCTDLVIEYQVIVYQKHHIFWL